LAKLSNLRLPNKVAVITGGSSGIGRATALLFAKEGARVAVVDVDSAKGEETVTSIRRNGGEAIFVKTDVSKTSDVQQMVKAVKEKYGKIDILFNNAGIHQNSAGTVVDLEEDDWNKVIDTNLKSMFLCSKYVIPVMAEGVGGSIINAGSIYGQIGSRKVPAYCASKGAIIALTKAMALDHADQRIRVNSTCPGTIYTPMVERFMNENYARYGSKSFDDMLESRRKAYPIGRIGVAEDIANSVLFLASDESSFITGTTITIDGGNTAQ
jgi:NAD(P)-dependent dehydrogenase (short-subunit alcohol dehydrogenase family)